MEAFLIGAVIVLAGLVLALFSALLLTAEVVGKAVLGAASAVWHHHSSGSDRNAGAAARS